MKTHHCFLLCLASLSFLACDRENPLELSTNKENNFVSESFVSEDMVFDLLERNRQNTKSSSPAYTVEAYTDSSLDTLMYIVRYGDNNGWQILSSDTRTPAILAESKTGSFSLEDGSPGFRIWIACMAHDIKMVRNSSDDQLSFSADEIAANKAFWTRGDDRGLFPPEDPGAGGEWHEHSTQEVDTLERVNHLTLTQWDQDNPYNYYCPFRTDTTTKKAPAGCAPVAAAQMIYYLHSKYGIPVNMVSVGYCVGNINNYEQHFDCAISTIWSQMGTLSEPALNPLAPVPESLLIGFVCNLARVNYGNDGSWTWDGVLDNRVFNVLGYDCSYDSYNETYVKNSLLNGDPVVVEAKYSLLPWTGHTFLIDGYLITRVHTTTLHYYLTTEGFPDPDKPDYYTHSYTNPDITKIKMNWGWWSQWDHPYDVNDGWFALTGGWTVNEGESNEHTYQYYRYIYHNFSVSNN